MIAKMIRHSFNPEAFAHEVDVPVSTHGQSPHQGQGHYHGHHISVPMDIMEFKDHYELLAGGVFTMEEEV